MFTAIALILWGLSVDDGSRVSRIIIGGAQSSAVITVLLWAALWVVITRERAEQRRADAERDSRHLLIRTLSAVAPAGPPPRAEPPRPTLPLRCVREQE